MLVRGSLSVSSCTSASLDSSVDAHVSMPEKWYLPGSINSKYGLLGLVTVQLEFLLNVSITH